MQKLPAVFWLHVWKYSLSVTNVSAYCSGAWKEKRLQSIYYLQCPNPEKCPQASLLADILSDWLSLVMKYTEDQSVFGLSPVCTYMLDSKVYSLVLWSRSVGFHDDRSGIWSALRWWWRNRIRSGTRKSVEEVHEWTLENGYKMSSWHPLVSLLGVCIVDRAAMN